MSFVAVILELFLQSRSLTLLGLVIAFIVYAGAKAKTVNNELPFWQCILSILLSCLLVKDPILLRTEVSGIVFATLFASAAYLSYAAVRYGHWATRVLAAFVFCAYTVLFIVIVLSTLENWTFHVEYWQGEYLR